MRVKKEFPMVCFEAKPKRGNSKVVDGKIFDLMALFAEIYDKNRRNCNPKPEKRGNMWTVVISFESDEARDFLVEDPRYQEILTDLEVFCKPAHRLLRFIYPILHPGKQLGPVIRGPIRLPE